MIKLGALKACTCEAVHDVHAAFGGLSEQNANNTLFGVPGHSVIMVHHAEQDQRVHNR